MAAPVITSKMLLCSQLLSLLPITNTVSSGHSEWSRKKEKKKATNIQTGFTVESYCFESTCVEELHLTCGLERLEAVGDKEKRETIEYFNT